MEKEQNINKDQNNPNKEVLEDKSEAGNNTEKKGLEESFAKADFARDYVLGKKWLIAMNELHKK